MNYKIYLLIFVSFMFNVCKSEWSLVWSDEFNEKSLNSNKWIIENDTDFCSKNKSQLNCNTNREKNLRLIDGTLAITAMPEKYLNRDFTSAMISTKQNFTFGRFEIRAALPNGQLLKTAIHLIPEDSSDEAEIYVLNHLQTPKIAAGVHYDIPAIYAGTGLETKADLNQFNTYAIEWNNSEIKWFFNEINYYSFNLSRKLGNSYERIGEPFDRGFRLMIGLSVGGNGAQDKLSVKKANKWKCSLLIIDYIKIYRKLSDTNREVNKIADMRSTTNICKTVMDSVRSDKNYYLSNSFSLTLNIKFVWFLSVFYLIIYIL